MLSQLSVLVRSRQVPHLWVLVSGIFVSLVKLQVQKVCRLLPQIWDKDREGGAFVEFAFDVDVGVHEVGELHGNV